jgi:hypothetical protein
MYDGFADEIEVMGGAEPQGYSGPSKEELDALRPFIPEYAQMLWLAWTFPLAMKEKGDLVIRIDEIHISGDGTVTATPAKISWSKPGEGPHKEEARALPPVAPGSSCESLKRLAHEQWKEALKRSTRAQKQVAAESAAEGLREVEFWEQLSEDWASLHVLLKEASANAELSYDRVAELEREAKALISRGESHPDLAHARPKSPPAAVDRARTPPPKRMIQRSKEKKSESAVAARTAVDKDDFVVVLKKPYKAQSIVNTATLSSAELAVLALEVGDPALEMRIKQRAESRAIAEREGRVIVLKNPHNGQLLINTTTFTGCELELLADEVEDEEAKIKLRQLAQQRLYIEDEELAAILGRK